MPLDTAFFRDMPKADLHVHVDGSVRTLTILELASEQGFSLPTTDPAELAGLVSVSPGSRSLAGFLKTFDVFYPLLKNADALERIARELILDETADGVRYVEARFAPALQAGGSLSILDAARAVARGLKAGSEETGTPFGLLLCCYRSEPPETSMRTLEAALALRAEGVVGLDLAGDELNFPALPHLEPFVCAREAGLPVTIHAGEVGQAANIREALFLFGAKRLGHAVRLPDDPELLAHVAREAVPVEVCLTSNTQTGAVPFLEAHPLLRFLEAGVPVVLNTDDPLVCRTTLSREYSSASDRFGLDVEAVKRICLNGFSFSFLPDPERRRLVENCTRWFDEHTR